MSKNEDFYNKFNSSSPKTHNLKSNIFVSFISGILGATLVLGLFFGAPNIRETLLSSVSTKSINPNSKQNSNLRNS